MGPVIRATGLGGWQFDWYRSMWKALGDYFRDPRLRQLFARYATYFGSSPFQAPGTLNLIFHVERIGVWSVRGGMYRLAEALRALAETLGVNVRCEHPVDEIVVERGKVEGVRSRGALHQADAVVVNAAPSALTAGHFGAAVRRAVGRRRSGDPSMRSLSAFTISARAKASGFPLAHHNVFFSPDYEDEFKRIFGAKEIPEEPTVYVCAQDRASHSEPAQKERLFFLVNAPPTGDGVSFAARVPTCLSQTLRHLERCGLHVDLQEDNLRSTTPSDFEALFPTTGGALYGMATHGFMAPFQRPPTRTKIRGLYLAGGGAHPGAGVPMVAMSGRIAARAIVSDLPSTSSRSPAATSGGTSTSSPKTANAR
jgi:1-hydroxycarotenoid 3,4-desaturase